MFGRKSRRIAELDRQLGRALGIITEKNDALAEALEANEQLDARNERLHHDIAAMRERLPKVAEVPAPGVPPLAEIKERLRRDAAAFPLPADPDTSQPYIPTYSGEFDDAPLASAPYIPTYEEEGK